MSKRLFDWNEYKEGNILVVFSNYGEVRDFCRKALEEGLLFLNKKTTIRTTYDSIGESNYRLGLACNKSGKMLRKDKKLWEGEIINFDKLNFLEYPHTEKTLMASGNYTLNEFFERKIAINCKTEVEAKMLFRVLKKHGWRWAGGEALNECDTHWHQEEERTTYNATNEYRYRENKEKRIRFGSLEYARDNLDFKVVDFKEVMY